MPVDLSLAADARNLAQDRVVIEDSSFPEGLYEPWSSRADFGRDDLWVCSEGRRLVDGPAGQVKRATVGAGLHLVFGPCLLCECRKQSLADTAGWLGYA